MIAQLTLLKKQLLFENKKCTWLLGIIRFDTAHVGWLFRSEDLHKFRQAVFKLSGRLRDKKKENMRLWGNSLYICVYLFGFLKEIIGFFIIIFYKPQNYLGKKR